FTGLERLALKFDYESENTDYIRLAQHTFTEEETPDEVVEAEASVAWGASRFRTYSALARNKFEG
ncbi:hypothetical protein MMC22_011328, partial [Lobaria immixta]|nr:hypothetical protein [Lobaria immixta]